MVKFLLDKINNNIKNLLSKIILRKLFVILFLIFVSVIIAVFLDSTYKTIYKTVYQERVDRLKYIAEFATDVIGYHNSLVISNQVTLKQAEKEAKEIIKRVRFENNDYIWINGYDGTIIYHPYSELIGKDINTLVDVNGYHFGQDLIGLVKQEGRGYVNYYWQKLNEDKDKIYPKVSYVSGFKPWGWIIGTGVYVDDINEKVIKSMEGGILPVLLVLLFMILVFRYILWAAIVIPIEELADKSLKLSNNDLSVDIPDGNTQTEIGNLYTAFHKFVDFFKEKRDNENKLSLIHDGISDVIITVDATGTIQSVNSTVKKMFGYKVEEIIGKNVNLLTSPVLIGDNANIVKDRSIETGKYEMLGIKKSEEFFHIEINLDKFLYNDKTMFILLIRDITEQNKINQVKNEFVSVVSHELRTPLTSIRGSLGLLLSGVYPTVTGKVKMLIDLAHNNCLRLIDLINDILDIEKIDAGKIEFNYEPTKVFHIINDVVYMNEPYADKFKVNYNIINNVPEDMLFNIDRIRFTQILTNLLSNSTKFSPENGEVIISIDYVDDIVHIAVRDFGKGIPDEFLDKVFDKFTQADSSDARQKGGTGLGLSICKKLVEEMNGTISFDTKLNEGTTFYLKFPIYKNKDSKIII